ncbi:CoB--CoM heterodisulfide reductase subunit B [candidate division WOR-3 bacterium]|nr:CoB--CoM heterodisulfide reductase subunit B [candidate division WOR-3 bacterium]
MKVIPFWGCMIPLKYPQMELAIRKTMPNLGIELVDIEGFTCCPDPIYFKAKDMRKWLVIAARNLAVAEEKELDIVTVCSGCTATLKEASYLLNEDEKLKKDINKELKKIGREYKGIVKVKHAIQLIRDDIGLEAVEKSVKRHLKNLNVAIHYGCHLLKPSQIMGVDDADYPSILENFTSILGATPISHQKKLLCCGKGCLDSEIPMNMVYDIFSSIEDAKGDCMGLICPTCFSSFDLGQVMIARTKGKEFNIPVIYFFQLLGLAQGYTPEEVGLHMHRVKVDALMEKIRTNKVLL